MGEEKARAAGIEFSLGTRLRVAIIRFQQEARASRGSTPYIPMSTTDESKWPRLERVDTSNATFIAWHKKDDKNNYDPNTKWQDDRYPRCYGDYYQHLDEYNNGYKNGKYRNKSYYTWLENDRLISSVSQQMELTSGERGRAKGYFHQLPLKKFWGFKEDVAVVVCLYVIEHDQKDRRRGHPNTLEKWQYLLIEQELGVSRSKVVRNYGRLEHRVRTGRVNEAPQHDKYRDRFSLSPEMIEYEQTIEGKMIAEMRAASA